ncbi:MAG: sulfatase-like hydrolase/transferase [Planctomycetaceae bacterium]
MGTVSGWLTRFVVLMCVMGDLPAASTGAERVPVSGAKGSPSRPNIVVMLVDDMGVMDTSVPFLTDRSGKPQRYPLNDYYRTPAMQALADRGVRFSQLNAMSVCSPTRIAIMTGQNAARHRTTNWINPDTNNRGPQGPQSWNWLGLSPGDVTLPGLLRSHGYRTIHVGKGHFSPRNYAGANPANLGFDVNVAGASIGAPASYYGQKNYGNAGGSVKKTEPAAVPGLERFHGTDTFLTDALTEEAKRHVSEAVTSHQPFFLYFAQYAVHAPFNSDPRFADHYRDSGKPANAQAFATLVEGMDKSLGDLMQHLHDLGVAENTLVIFLGDNGSDAPLGHEHDVACAAPLRGRKGSHYEGGVRVPMIVSWGKPDSTNVHQQRLKISAGTIQTQLAAVHDVFPTILSVAEIPVPESHVIDGQNLVGLLTGQPDPGHRSELLVHYPHAPHRSGYWSSFRDEDWKVVYHYIPGKASSGSHYQLFHLSEDPFEQQDFAARDPENLQRMMKRLTESLEQHNAVYPTDKSGNELKPK